MEKQFYKALLAYDTSQPAVLCSQVEWKGSVPRKDYPSMLVPVNGRPLGTIGGGSMEGRVLEMARGAARNGETMFVNFDLSHEDPDAEGGICGGRMKVLIQPFSAEVQAFWRTLELDQRTCSNPAFVITEIVTSNPATVRRFQVDDGAVPGELPGEVADTLETVRRTRKSRALDLPEAFYLVQRISPPAVLHLFGAGHVAKAVAELAHFIDMDTCVYDDRPDMATRERFPHARCVLAITFDELVERVALDEGDFVLVATAGHRHDLEVLRWLLGGKLGYIGMVSSRTKWRIVSETLREEGVPEEILATVHAPVGLDIHSETVPEIAISIISEIVLQLRTMGEKGARPALVAGRTAGE